MRIRSRMRLSGRWGAPPKALLALVWALALLVAAAGCGPPVDDALRRDDAERDSLPP